MGVTVGGSIQQPVGRAKGARKIQLRLAVALPFVTSLLSCGIGLYAFQVGRSDATSLLAPREAALIWSTSPGSWWWLVGLTLFGGLIGLSVAMAFTRQLHTLARRTEFLARRNFSFPVELEADGEVAPLVAAINDLLESVRTYARHSVADGVISFSRDGRVLSINPRATVALGVDAEEVIGRTFRDLIPDVPANEQLLGGLVRALERSEPFDLEQLVWVNTRGQRLEVDLHGTVLAGEESIISVLIVFDRTPDMETVQRQVSRAHRLLVIGGFAAELAHEVRNPLASIVGLVELLHEQLPPGDEGHLHLEVLSRAAGRIERLVSQLLDLVPTEIQDLERTDLATLVHETVEFVRHAQTDGRVIHVFEEHEVGLPDCQVDVDRFTRAIENVVRNAFAHTPAGGTITVRTRLLDDDNLEVEVRNTGSWVPPEDRERIFQPFVSRRSGGTGLGLAIAQQIAYAHGGWIDVHSEEGSHTAFVIRLPVVTETPEPVTMQPRGPQRLAAGM